MGTKLELVWRALQAVDTNADRIQGVQKFLIAMFEFGVDCLASGSPVSTIVNANCDNKDLSRAVGQHLLEHSAVAMTVEEIGRRFCSHAESITAANACKVRSGLEFLTKDFADCVQVLVGDGPNKQEWRRTEALKKYTDILIKEECLNQYDKLFKNWMAFVWDEEADCNFPNDREVTIPQGVPHSHWWWNQIDELRKIHSEQETTN